jgi:hypothetical protein
MDVLTRRGPALLDAVRMMGALLATALARAAPIVCGAVVAVVEL